MFQFYRVTKAKMLGVRRYWLTIAFVLGFVIDNLTLNRVDQVFDNIILFSYVVLAMVSLVLLYAGAAGKLPERMIAPARAYAPLLVQFSFGGLLSGMLIFYGRSGTLLDSWPFIALILLVIVSNETIRNREQRLVYNLAIFFVGLFAYVVLVIPVFTGLMGKWVFLGSGLLALGIMMLFFKVLTWVVPRFMLLQKKNVVFVVGLIYVSFNFLYFTNLIPPIPLSLKEIGIYHSVIRYGDGDYRLTYEDPAWWQPFRESNKNFVYRPGDNMFCFASVFAPTRLATDIYHRWQHYDEVAGEWVDHGRFSYPIEGGRGEGFRGYTLVENYTDGTWRCVVETERGQIIGKRTFEVSGGERRELVTRDK